VFEREPPINVAYEFLNVGGRKMSTSKGRGTAAHRIVEVLPPEPLRTLMIRTRPQTALDFEPEGTDQVPRQFDEFDRLAAATAGRDVKGELPPGFDAVFRYALRDPDADVDAEAAAFRPSFAHLAFLLQVPGADVPALVAAEKGSALTEHEQAILDERLAAARVWLDDYAPERARMRVQESLPVEAAKLDAMQRAFLGTLAEDADTGVARSGDDWQASIFATAAAGGLAAGQAFKALYLAFLGRPNGPRAGWLLASLDRSFVAARLREAAGGGTLPA
jgi:lysyl-tRNA synthetase class 1